MSLHNPISPLRAYYVQKVLPAVYDDSLSYYEILCKVQETLNEVVSTTNEQSVVVLEMQQAINDFIHGGYTDTFEEYLDEWFEENSDAFVQRLIDEGIIPEVESLQESLSETIGRLDNLFEITVSTFPTKVPFPLSQSEPYYGEIGQVLTTNEDGTTSWNDPVVPSDEQAEEIITTWLNAHPEATTTVQDGAITDPKISSLNSSWTDGSSIIMRRVFPSDVTALEDVRLAGIYAIDYNNRPHFSDEPSDIDTTQRFAHLIVYTGAFGNILAGYQIYIDYVGSMWTRRLLSNSTEQWHRLFDKYRAYPVQISGDQITDGTITGSKISDGAITDPKIANSNDSWDTGSSVVMRRGEILGETTLGEHRLAGIYQIDYNHTSHFSDEPSDIDTSQRFAHLIVYAGAFGAPAGVYQLYCDYSGSVWVRWLLTNSVGDWHRLFKKFRAPAVVKSSLENGKLVTVGDSYTAANFDGANNGRNYGYYVAQRNDMSFVNDGISGSILALSEEYIAGTENISYRSPYTYQRYLNIPSDATHLTIMFGINDYSHTTLGTINDTTNETFYGALNFIMKYLLTNKPFLHVGFMVPPNGYTNVPARYVLYQNAIRETAVLWGYPVLDFVKDMTIAGFFQRDGMGDEATELRKDAFGWNTYTRHPNPQWHNFISSRYEQFLKEI